MGRSKNSDVKANDAGKKDQPVKPPEQNAPEPVKVMDEFLAMKEFELFADYREKLEVEAEKFVESTPSGFKKFLFEVLGPDIVLEIAQKQGRIEGQQEVKAEAIAIAKSQISQFLAGQSNSVVSGAGDLSEIDSLRERTLTSLEKEDQVTTVIPLGRGETAGAAFQEAGVNAVFFMIPKGVQVTIPLSIAKSIFGYMEADRMAGKDKNLRFNPSIRDYLKG